MDPAVAVIGVIVIFFAVLIGLVVRKMVRGQINPPEQADQLEPGEKREDLEALEREALGEEVAPPKHELEKEAPKPSALKQGLDKTRKGFMSRINELLRGRALDAGLLDELESILVTSDIGIRTAERLLSDLREQLTKKEISDPEVVRARLKSKVLEIVTKPAAPLDFNKKPLVIMVIGVNGVGKTTTIGKLAARFTKEGKKVVLAAGDTFRAAAVEQLEIWGQRGNVEVVKGPDGGDPSAVMFSAIQKAQSIGADIVISDTAGRLHTKVNLMEELKKVRRVMNKAMEGAPHEVLLVLDATTGQNAIQQAKQFKEAVDVGSIALTKLDGTAKGGVVVAICDDLGVPVRYIGIGEQIEDLRDFDPREFVEALFDRDGT
jgi:fused signal recognition particle receptor